MPLLPVNTDRSSARRPEPDVKHGEVRMPLDPQVRWNRQGMGVNGVQRVAVTVQPGIGAAGTRVPSPARAAVAGAEVPAPLRDTNAMILPR